MKLWKMSIKTGGAKGDQAFDWCRERKIVGVGWSYVYDGLAEIPADPLTLLAGDRRGVSPVRMVIHRMKAGEFVWLHSGGGFYLCRILDFPFLAGPQVGEGFREYDVGHARRAEWVLVPEDLVPGKVQRAVISRRMVCDIPCGKRLASYCAYLHAALNANPGWRPAMDPVAVRATLTSMTASELEECVSPDDWEDIIAAYLQGQGWVLVKSSCFPSKPRFEFRMIREEAGATKTAYLQVKSGQVQLRPEGYADDAASATVYLFSTHPSDPYPGPAVPGVVPLALPTVRAWMTEHIPLLPLPLCTQLVFDPKAAGDGAKVASGSAGLTVERSGTGT